MTHGSRVVTNSIPSPSARWLGGSPRWIPAYDYAGRLWRGACAKPLGAYAGLLMLGMVIVAVLAPVLAPYDPFEQHPDAVIQAPGADFWFGADELGRDILSRLMYGARLSLWVGLCSVTLGTLIGACLGIVSGYVGGRLDLAVQRCMDAMMAFPAMFLALALMSVLGASTTNVILAVGIVLVPGAARVVRGTVLSAKANQYVEAAIATGCPAPYIMWRHILPNITAPIIVLSSTYLGNAILVESSLSFLGLGPPPQVPTWGGMLSGGGRDYFEVAPWLAIFPGAAISLAVLAFNLLGDALRDLWDPFLKGERKSER